MLFQFDDLEEPEDVQHRQREVLSDEDAREGAEHLWAGRKRLWIQSADNLVKGFVGESFLTNGGLCVHERHPVWLRRHHRRLMDSDAKKVHRRGDWHHIRRNLE